MHIPFWIHFYRSYQKWNCLIKNRYFTFFISKDTAQKRERIYFAPPPTYIIISPYPPQKWIIVYTHLSFWWAREMLSLFILIYIFFPISELEHGLLCTLALYLSFMKTAYLQPYFLEVCLFLSSFIGSCWYFHITRNLI